MEGTKEKPTESAISRRKFALKLHNLKVPKNLIDESWPIVKGRALGVLLYGSWARGDAGALSDLDLLLLSNSRSGIRASGIVSVTFYNTTQLREAQQTLYGMHLARDGVILHDCGGKLAGILSTFTPPDPAALLRRIRGFGITLDVTADDRAKYLPGLAQVARYLLRTATYAIALQDNAPCFSVEELAVRFRQPELTTLLSSHPGVYPAPTPEILADLTRRLTSTVGPLPPNPFRSLHALIIATSITDPDVSHLATFALGADESLPYSEIPKVVL